MTDGSNKEDLLNNKDVFKYFENFINYFSSINKEIFLWRYQINQKTSKFIYSSNLPLILKIDDTNIDDLKKGLATFIFEEDIIEYQSNIESFLADTNNKVLDHEYRIRTKDGTIVYIREKIVKEIVKKNITLTGFAIDVTAYKSTLSMVMQTLSNQKEQILSRDRFFSILSHDLRAPFTSIIGFTEILLNDNSLSDKERSEFLTYIQDSATNQLEFVNYILDWSNLKLGRIQLNLQKVGIADLIYNAISNLTGSSIKKNIEIKPQINDSLYVKVDERLALQAITNLINNSIKFTPDGKKIFITTNMFNKDFVEIIIRDEGVGIPEDHRAKLFNLDNLFTKRGTKGEKGTGIGLSLIKEIVEKHNGQIWFHSKENQGTEFHLTLPSYENIILIVEPDNQTATIIETLINNHFWMLKPVLCSNAYKALEVLIENIPSIILLNPQLELMDGIDFYKTLNKIIPNFNNPIILILNDSSEIEKYEHLGIKKFVTKPINLNRLSDIISDFVSVKSF
jgi:signal transduction histidine kinase/CheY-like chemotaxis protein